MRLDFEDYVRQQRTGLFLFAMVLCGDPVVAEDLVQDVLGRAFEQWARVSAADKIHAYVRRMVVNEYLSRRRRARTVPTLALSSLYGLVAQHASARWALVWAATWALAAGALMAVSGPRRTEPAAGQGEHRHLPCPTAPPELSS